MRYRIGLSVIALALCGSLLTSEVHAVPGWYAGKIEFIYLYNGGFNVNYVGTAIDDCLYDRIYFSQATLGKEIIDRAYSMVLAAQASGRTVSIVVDKAINGPEGYCYAANGSMLIKD